MAKKEKPKRIPPGMYRVRCLGIAQVLEGGIVVIGYVIIDEPYKDEVIFIKSERASSYRNPGEPDDEGGT